MSANDGACYNAKMLHHLRQISTTMKIMPMFLHCRRVPDDDDDDDDHKHANVSTLETCGWSSIDKLMLIRLPGSPGAGSVQLVGLMLDRNRQVGLNSTCWIEPTSWIEFAKLD